MVSPLRGLWFAWLNYSAFDVHTSIDTCMGACAHTHVRRKRLWSFGSVNEWVVEQGWHASLFW